jgi:hypothetical protein
MAYVLHDELRIAQSLKFQPLFMGMFYTHTFQNMDFNTRVELNMFFTFVVVLSEYAEVHGCKEE